MEQPYECCSIRDYGLIGDLNSAALVSMHGSIDWLCFPRFDSPSVFAAILDPEVGGRFTISTPGIKEARQAYVEDTNILRTVLRSEKGSLEILDYMPCYLKSGELEAFHEVHRRLRCIDGSAEALVHFEPRFEYGLEHAEMTLGKGGCLAKGSEEWLSLATELPLRKENGACEAQETLAKGDERWFVLRWNDDYLRPLDEFNPREKMEKTLAYWRSWVGQCTYKGPWESLMRRSLLALKLMLYDPTGASIAAPTTSLPEVPGGQKNWDYRYSWLRDSSFILSAFHRCGFTQEERMYRRWLIRRLRGHTLELGSLQVMYGVEGDADLREAVLPHLRGYKGAKPVRTGNAAHNQFQLDIYGVIVDALHFTYHREEDMNDDVWRTVESIANFVANNWERPDSGIWELREAERRYTYSNIMAWVAMDRAVKIAERWGNPHRAALWSQVRERIRESVLLRGFDQELETFVQHYGGKALDANVLIIPLVRFLPGTDERFLKTLERVRAELSQGPLLWRFREDGPREGAFLMLSYWLVEGLAEAGRLEEAVELFEQLAHRANHLGLYSEMIDPATGDFVGNFPQAFTHMALVNAAWSLARNRERVQGSR